ncbi:MAG: hypothetical protein U0169_17250 [Polyangiaceae bacterium]
MGRAACATALVVASMVACSESPPTAIRFSVSTLFTPGAVRTLVLRVFGSEGRLSFCGTYPVDERAPAGSSATLFSGESTLVLAPRGDPEGPVRVVAELHSDDAPSACDGAASPGLLARKVSVVRYAKGASLRLRALFEASCLGVVSCDATTETCSAGRCVPAEEGISGSVDAPCFDLGSCPRLERATRVGPCRYLVSGDPTRGYVAVSYRFPDPVPGRPDLHFASVLSLDEYVVDAPVSSRTVELEPRLCELETRGYLEAVYFGFECAAPGPSAPVCTNDSADADDSPLVTVVTGGGPGVPGPDAGVRDATIDVVADATDGTADDSGDARSDARSADSGADAEGIPQDAGDAEGGGDDAGDGGGHAPRVRCDMTFDCAVPSTSCCVSTDPHTCDPATGTSCFARWGCDDRDDCPSNQVCCRTGTAPLYASSCMDVGACVGNGGTPVCSTDSATCPARTRCVPNRIGLTNPGAYECRDTSLDVGTIACGPSDCTSITEACCASTNYACLDVASQCSGAKIACDDQADCDAVPGNAVCCYDTNSPRSFCSQVPSMDCTSTSGWETLCSVDDATCPPGQACVASSRTFYAKLHCR